MRTQLNLYCSIVNGFAVPTYCYHNDLSIAGNCRYTSNLSNTLTNQPDQDLDSSNDYPINRFDEGFVRFHVVNSSIIVDRITEKDDELQYFENEFETGTFDLINNDTTLLGNRTEFVASAKSVVENNDEEEIPIQVMNGRFSECTIKILKPIFPYFYDNQCFKALSNNGFREILYGDRMICTKDLPSMMSFFTMAAVCSNENRLNDLLSLYVKSFEEGILESDSSEKDETENPTESRYNKIAKTLLKCGFALKGHLCLNKYTYGGVCITGLLGYTILNNPELLAQTLQASKNTLMLFNTPPAIEPSSVEPLKAVIVSSADVTTNDSTVSSFFKLFGRLYKHLRQFVVKRAKDDE